MKKNNSLILSVMCYIVVFIMIQFGISLVALYLDDSIKHPASASPTALSLSSAVASIVIIGLFLWRTAPLGRAGMDHISCPWRHTPATMDIRAAQHHRC